MDDEEECQGPLSALGTTPPSTSIVGVSRKLSESISSLGKGQLPRNFVEPKEYKAASNSISESSNLNIGSDAVKPPNASTLERAATVGIYESLTRPYRAQVLLERLATPPLSKAPPSLSSSSYTLEIAPNNIPPSSRPRDEVKHVHPQSYPSQSHPVKRDYSQVQRSAAGHGGDEEDDNNQSLPSPSSSSSALAAAESSVSLANSGFLRDRSGHVTSRRRVDSSTGVVSDDVRDRVSTTISSSSSSSSVPSASPVSSDGLFANAESTWLLLQTHVNAVKQAVRTGAWITPQGNYGVLQ